MESVATGAAPPTLEEGEGKGDGVPPPTPSPGGRSSPPPDCAICLMQCKNKSFTDSCLHQFCFHCLLTWSKIKPECPLCKQTFKSIIHNVKSNHQYEEYLVEPPDHRAEDFLEVDYYETPRFRYRTTLTLHRHEGLALERLLLRYPIVPLGALPTSLPPPPPPPPPRHSRRPRPSMFRQSVYRNNLWACPLPDVTGRRRECSPEFYRHNPAQIHRLVPWLTRELAYLISDSNRVLSRILETLTVIPILTTAFRELIHPYLNIYTDHFIHEFYSFASSPFDMVGYDCAVQYQAVDSRVTEVLSSSDGENSTDSDIVVVSSAGPSHAFPVPFSAPPEPGPSARRLGGLSDPVIAIETLSHSDTEDSSDEVVMVGYIKPPHQRTPEVVDLIASDSDTVIIEEPGQSTETVEEPPTPTSSGLVKVSLKRKHDGSEEDRVDGKRERHTRPLSRHSASTECTDRDTDCSDSDFEPNSDSEISEDSSASSDYEVSERRASNKSKQVLASKILKELKRNSWRKRLESAKLDDSDGSRYESEYEDCSSQTSSTSHNSSKRKLRKKSRRKKRPEVDTDSNSSSSLSQRLKFESHSKSKERMITKIFENKQSKSAKGKTSLSNKSKAKNKCFVKSSNRNMAETTGPSTSRGESSRPSEADTENPEHPWKPEDEAQGTSSNLLDIMGKSILSSNNPVLSIHSESSPAPGYSNDFPDDIVASLLNQFDENFFNCVNPRPLNLSANKEINDEFG